MRGQRGRTVVAMTLLEDQPEYAQDSMMQRCTPIFVETGDIEARERELSVRNREEYNPWLFV
jgi:hypothetical protein